MCANDILSQIFSDICSKLPMMSCKGFAYFATFIDDKSWKVFTIGLCKKSDLLHHFKVFVTWEETQTGKHIKCLHSDGGGKYVGNASKAYYKEKGICHKITTPSTPQHNGVAKCMNWTLLDTARTMLVNSNLLDLFWFDALEYASIIHNSTPYTSLQATTPNELYSGNKPDVSHLHIFSCNTYVHIHKDKRSKLSSHTLKTTFLGLINGYKAFKLFHHLTRQEKFLCDVVFAEGGFSTHILIEHNNTESSHPDHASIVHTNASSNPCTYAEAMARADTAEWEIACNTKR
jgi:hypothetical protein